eukprot:6982722-Prymnesium_polylepis.1
MTMPATMAASRPQSGGSSGGGAAGGGSSGGLAGSGGALGRKDVAVPALDGMEWLALFSFVSLVTLTNVWYVTRANSFYKLVA